MNKKIMSFRYENTTAQLLEQMAQSEGKTIPIGENFRNNLSFLNINFIL